MTRTEPPIEAYPEGSSWRYDIKLHDQNGRLTGPMKRIDAVRLLRRYGLTDNQITNRLNRARQRYKSGTSRG